MTMSLSHIVMMMPELIAGIAAMIALIFGVFKKKNTAQIVLHIILGVLLGVLFLVVTAPSGRFMLFNGSFVTDYFGLFAKALILLATFLVLFSCRDVLFQQGIIQFEYSVLVLLSVLGMMIMVSAQSLLTVFMGLELQSLSLYILTALRRDDLRASEAGLKYFILGAVSTGLLLYGISLLYGVTGHLTFSGLSAALTGAQPIIVWVGMVCFMVGLLFKISAVPFHMWTPDVYQGAPTVMTAFLATAPKIAAFALLLRVLFNAFPGAMTQWQPVLEWITLLSMVVGSFAALFQKDIKRLLAYSTIGNMGYMLIGVVVGSEFAVQSSLIYLVLYVLTVIGFFACLNRLSQGGEDIETVADLAGIYRQTPTTALAMIFFLFSFAGVPPLAGFLGKLYVFRAAVDVGFMMLAIVGVLTSVVAAAYYLWIIKTIIMDEPATGRNKMMRMTDAVPMMIATALMVVLSWMFIQPQGLLTMTSAAVSSLMGQT